MCDTQVLVLISTGSLSTCGWPGRSSYDCHHQALTHTLQTNHGQAKYETTGQIVTLFVGAACVGVLLIMLLTAEANKRQDALDRSDEVVVTETGDMSELTGIKYIWNKMRSSFR